MATKLNVSKAAKNSYTKAKKYFENSILAINCHDNKVAIYRTCTDFSDLNESINTAICHMTVAKNLLEHDSRLHPDYDNKITELNKYKTIINNR